MKETIDRFIRSTTERNGLLLADLPTGYGKTYRAARSIHEYIRDTESLQKVFFITTLIKNLPIDELKKAYKDAGDSEGYDRDVLVIRSNFDCVRKSLLGLNVPEQHQTEAYWRLREKLETLERLEKRGGEFSVLKGEIAKEIQQKLEPDFRTDIKRIIKKELPNRSNERREAIRGQKNYRWIGELYPAVFTSDYKVYLMTVDKFLVKNSTLVEPSYEFIQHSISDNAIIFIDEFDATKETIQKSIIQKAINSQQDYISLFKQLHDAMLLRECPDNLQRPYQEYMRNHKSAYGYEDLQKEAESIYKEFHLKHSYKTVSGDIDRRQNFLFNDGSYHTMLRNNRTHIRVTPNEEARQVSIHFEGKDEYDRNKSGQDIIIHQLIRSINGFLNRFRLMVFGWSSVYADCVNRSREETEDLFSAENAMRTICRHFELSEGQAELLMGGLNWSGGVQKEEGESVPDLSFYANGFRYFEFTDSDSHLTQTAFNYIQILDTPEKILLYLCRKSKVVGISATATLPTVIANYDTGYLSDMLKDRYVQAENEVYENIRQELDQQWMAYSEGRISVRVEIIDHNLDHLLLEERLKDVASDRDFVKGFASKIQAKVGDNEYLWKRYCSIIKAMREFVARDDIQSFLCLNMVLPKSGGNSPAFDRDLLEEAMDDLLEIHGKAKGLSASSCIVVLKGENFAAERDEVLDRLGRGEKIFIFSSYKTIGAGQNLQYDAVDVSRFVKTGVAKGSDDSRIWMKDMDALFLGDITNISVNTYDAENFGKEELARFLFQAEYLYQNDEISHSILNRLIRLGFRAYAGNREGDSVAAKKLSDAKSIRRQATRDIMQAVGRICRTFLKNPVVYIYTVESVMTKVEFDCLEGQLLCPEMKALVDAKRQFGYRQREEDERVLNRAERISTRGKELIMKMLSRDWTEESMLLWKRLRETVLAKPTATPEESRQNEIIEKLYVTGGEAHKAYLYAQKGDFSDVVIEFENDRHVFAAGIRCEGKIVSCVSEDDARLQDILRYPGMQRHFWEKGWATSFMPEEFILSPVLFHNIYKGALGEAAGRYILQRELGMELHEIEDPSSFEFFDYQINEGVYLDFKHWKQQYMVDREKTREEIRRKLDIIGGQRVYIINILAVDSFVPHNDGRIVEIPCLLNTDGTANEKALRLLKGECI
ncbi:hypothetical protein [Anaerobium acetethylicum]|uniref:Helicase/UvrB N-terminal domain-containing protein n=1 Tax=Anaerobium acetethylicum TaxID=1619234 RepID=A0A1D3TXP8_9FIRM|nr:hypothetical protein [Anaerobium acetethylicum]SCP99160.1 hypothetical protein SAMN05421730_103324 [Anaerobium acetethylicum]